MNENAGKRKHKLLTKELAAKLPPLYSTEDTPLKEKVIAVKFFSPYNGWRWYVVEGEERDGDWLLFAWVEGWENELGYVSLAELEEITVFGDVPAVERDIYFGNDQKLGAVAKL